MGDIHRAGFALLFAGQVMSGVAWAFLAVAAWAAATPVDPYQTGAQDGGLGMKFFEAGQEVAADQGGMFWDFELWPRASAWRVHIG